MYNEYEGVNNEPESCLNNEYAELEDKIKEILNTNYSINIKTFMIMEMISNERI